MQVVGSVQYTNDVDCHVALICAPSYSKERAEKYYLSSKTNEQIIREYVDMFGFLSKSANGMDIILEECKALLKTWGSPDGAFILCNARLTFNLAMSPDRTSYATYGPDGLKRLQDGPEVPSYRGIKIIHSRSFSLEDGMPPRDIMLRRVRVAEYYSIPKPSDTDKIQLYDEGRDAWVTFTWNELVEQAKLKDGDGIDPKHVLLIRPNIEHQMFGVIVGKAGEQTGATFWGQVK